MFTVGLHNIKWKWVTTSTILKKGGKGKVIRGTTPRIIFKINNLEDFSEIKDVWISIKNKNCSLLNKSYLNEEVDLDEDKMTISAGFTQEETLKFSMPLVKAQLKILLVDGTVCASPIFDVSVDDILNPKLMENTEVGD